MRKILLVTGGSRGIGAAIAVLAAEQGYDVAVNYAGNKPAADAVVARIEAAGRQAVAIQADMAVEADIDRMFETVDRVLGPLTHLVNNAGLTGVASRLGEVSTEVLKRVFDVNILGCFLCARAAIRRMSTAHGGSGGAIVNLSSAAATLGSPGEYVWYAASKGAIDTMTMGLGRELAKEGIRVNAVAPGLIDTEIHATGGDPDRLRRLAPVVPMGRAGTDAEVARTVLFLLSDEASYVTGSILRVSGGR